MPYSPGTEQVWHTVDLGYESAYPTITGPIFELGFTDSILQMWASFCDQLTNGTGNNCFRCATPEETAQHHRVLTAALQSQAQKRAISLDEVL